MMFWYSFPSKQLVEHFFPNSTSLSQNNDIIQTTLFVILLGGIWFYMNTKKQRTNNKINGSERK